MQWDRRCLFLKIKIIKVLAKRQEGRISKKESVTNKPVEFFFIFKNNVLFFIKINAIKSNFQQFRSC